MDWKDVGKIIAPLAPMAGSILGGLIPFPGGSIIGQKLGEMIAGAFGVAPTPQAVSEAVANSTEETARVKINAAVEQARIEIAGFVEIEKAYLHAIEVGLAQTGETMRIELAHEHWFFTGWRPAIGWVFVAFALTFGAMLTVAAGAAAFWSNGRPLQILTESWPIFLAYFGTLGLMVGVYIPSRSAEKKTAIESGTVIPNAKPVVPAKPVVVLPEKPANVPMPPIRPQLGSKPVGSRD